MTKIYYEKWIKFLEGKQFSYNTSFGFREGSSCTTKLQSFIPVINIMQDWECWLDWIYPDFKKPFDNMPHTRLLWKLKRYIGVHMSCKMGRKISAKKWELLQNIEHP